MEERRKLQIQQNSSVAYVLGEFSRRKAKRLTILFYLPETADITKSSATEQ